jgi:hypothetical protein
MTAAGDFQCTPWCTDDDRHVRYHLRADQSCWGPIHKTVFGLDPHAPALPMTEISCDTAGISVYAYQAYYELPKVKLNVYAEDGKSDDDFLLTPGEAVELAGHLITVVETIVGAK